MKLFKPALIRKMVIGIAVLVGAYAAAGFFLVPLGLKPWIEKRLAWHLQGPVEIRSVRVNPFTFTLNAQGISVQDRIRKRTLASAAEIYLNLQTSSVYHLGVILKELRIRDLQLDLARSREGVWNISSLFEGKPAASEPPGRVSKAISFLKIRRVVLIGGKVSFQDAAAAAEHTFRAGSFQMAGFLLDWRNKKVSADSFSARKGDLHSRLLKDTESAAKPVAAEKKEAPGQRWELAVKRVGIDQFTVSAENDRTPRPVTLKAGKIKIAAENVSTREHARGSLSCSFVFNDSGEFSAAGPFTLVPASADLKVEAKGIPLPPLQSFAQGPLRVSVVSGVLSASGGLSLGTRKTGELAAGYKGSASVADFASQGRDGHALLRWEFLAASGLDLGINPGHLSAAEISLRGFAGSLQRSPDGKIDVQEILPEKSPAAGEGRAGSFPVRVDRVHFSDGQIRFTDRSLPSPVTWEADRIALKMENLNTKEGAPARVTGSFVLNQQGEVSFDGSGTLAPVSWNTALRLKGVPVVSLHPYILTRIRGDIGGGILSGDGRLSVALPRDGALQASFRGAAALTGFSFFSEAHRELLRWKTAAVEGLEAKYAPLSLKAARISLDDFFLRASVESDGTFNFTQIVKPPAEKSPTRVDAAIRVVDLRGGKIRFSDRRIQPRFAADLDNLAGRIEGLSTTGGESARVAVSGKWNGQAPVDINGRVNLFGDEFFVNLSASLKNVQASPFSPYSVKFMGYTINRGQVSMEMKYQIVRTNLEGTNRIQLDNFFLGKEVSPVLQVPVQLVIALLKNREGEIHLDVPVSGDLKNPHFGVTNSIFDFLRNLFIRIAASPFKFLGSIFAGQGDEELGRIEFSPGSTDLDPGAKEKLDILATALFDRPGLDLEIQGRADPEKDGEPLKRQILERRLKIQKQKDLIAQGRPPASLREIAIAPEEYVRYVRQVYTAEFAARTPGRVPPAEVSLTEMERAVLARTPLPQGDLEELAGRRARVVESYILTAQADIKPDRIFVVEPVVARGKEGQAGGEVDFRLR